MDCLELIVVGTPMLYRCAMPAYHVGIAHIRNHYGGAAPQRTVCGRLVHEEIAARPVGGGVVGARPYIVYIVMKKIAVQIRYGMFLESKIKCDSPDAVWRLSDTSAIGAFY